MNAVLSDPLAPYRVDAMEQAIEAVMRGERFPKRGYPAIVLADFLDQCVSVTEQTEAFCKLIAASEDRHEMADVMFDIRKRYEKLLRAHLAGSEVIENEAQRLYEAEMEEVHG